MNDVTVKSNSDGNINEKGGTITGSSSCGDYSTPISLTHRACFFLAQYKGISPLVMILKVPGFAAVAM
jgi:hypothetical protein